MEFPESELNTKLETIACPFCNSDRFELLRKVGDRFKLSVAREYQIVACVNCNFVYLNPRPKVEHISDFYANGAYQPFLSTRSAVSGLDRVYLWVRNLMVGRKRRVIEKFVKCGKLLDIGCGTGEFLREMEKHGWSVAGLEKDEKAAEFAQKQYGLKVTTLEFSQMPYSENSFDVVTLWHVLEHLYNPLQILRELRTRLKDSGVLVIAMPNINSFDARFYKANWVALDAPRHVQHFVPASLQAFCSASGFEIIQRRQLPFDALYNCLFSELLIARNSGKRFLLLFLLLRAFVIAMISLAVGSSLRRRESRNGSSMLYVIKPTR